jgi:hypothetical protein
MDDTKTESSKVEKTLFDDQYDHGDSDTDDDCDKRDQDCHDDSDDDYDDEWDEEDHDNYDDDYDDEQDDENGQGNEKDYEDGSDHDESEKDNSEKKRSANHTSKRFVDRPEIMIEDILSLPMGVMTALVYFYDTDDWVEKIEDMRPTWFYPTKEEEHTKRLVLVSRVMKMIKSQRVQFCVQRLLELFYSPHNISYTKHFAGVLDAIHVCDVYIMDILPLYLQKSKCLTHRRNKFVALCNQVLFQGREGLKHRYCNLMDHVCNRKKYLYHIYTTSYLTTPPSSLSSSPSKDNKTVYNPILWLPQTFNLMSAHSLRALISKICFHMFRHVCYTENDRDTLKAMLFVSSIDCFLSETPDDKQRFKEIIHHINHTLTDQQFCSFSDTRSWKGPVLSPSPSLASSYNKPPIETHKLLDGQNSSSPPQMPDLAVLENLLRPTTWDTLPSGSITDSLESLKTSVAHLCTWVKGFDANNRNIVIDSKRKKQIMEEIMMMGENSILNRALSITKPYEVCRCFHVSPQVITLETGSESVDMRAKGKEFAKACILFIMLSHVRNVVFIPDCETNCHTVVIPSTARHLYKGKQDNLSITLMETTSEVLSVTCIEKVIKAIQNRTDVMI